VPHDVEALVTTEQDEDLMSETDAVHLTSATRRAAEAQARRAVALREAALGADHPDVAAQKAALAAIVQQTGHLDEAEALLREALRVLVDAHGADHLQVGICRTSLGAVLHRRGRLDEADWQYRVGLALREQCAGCGDPALAATLTNLGVLARERGQDGEARVLFERVLAVLDAAVAEHPARHVCHEMLASLDARERA
jgi:Tfp pilus assembly protein PilF